MEHIQLLRARLLFFIRMNSSGSPYVRALGPHTGRRTPATLLQLIIQISLDQRNFPHLTPS